MERESKTLTKWLLYVATLWGFLIYFIWYCVNPKQPTYTIQEFYFLRPNPGNYTPTSNSTRLFSFKLEIKNPNKQAGIYHDETSLKFGFGKWILGEETIPSFYQKKGGSTRQMEGYVNNANKRLRKKIDRTISNSTVELKVALVTKIRYQTFGWETYHRGVNLDGCIRIGSDGKILGNKKKITLHHT
ncbi:hypothetical protein Vadar_026282 [Vaccinium darrowii]|uniref:Uncharacterized protein n=1 Tax=Vaccinium darrowii TaxID=229202 RepID=A0ACB7YYV7_9ERIC|nr:hypothetical protein Vadar_026282 [Vaccinium darrowii]